MLKGNKVKGKEEKKNKFQENDDGKREREREKIEDQTEIMRN